MGKLEKLKRIASEWGSHLTFADYALGIGKWVWGGVGTAFLSLLAAVTPWLKDVGPFGWFLIGLVGLVLFGCATALTSALIARTIVYFRSTRPTPALPQRAMPSQPAQPAIRLEPASAPAKPAPAVADNPKAKHKLATFVVQRVLPACAAQEELQLAALKRTCVENSSTHKLAKYGLRQWPEHREFHECMGKLDKIKSDNASSITFERLMDEVLLMSNKYPGYASYIHWICNSTGIDFRTDPNLKPLFESWVALNEQLEKEYKDFQSDTDFPKLNSLDQDRRQGRAFVTIV